MKKRNTRQKKTILSCLCDLGHPSASALFCEVQKKDPGISRATVFRILKEGAEDGTVNRFSVGDGEDRFDATLKPHSHVRCVICGRVDDVWKVPYDEGIDNKANMENGYRVFSHSLVFFGTCPLCVAAGKEPVRFPTQKENSL